jgi:hypothetical protein
LCGLFLNSEYRFPGYIALLPVGATIMLLMSANLKESSTSFIDNLLLVYLGKISYPLYLCHWPFLIITYIVFGNNISNYLLANIIIISILFAIFSHEIIENNRFKNYKYYSTILSALLFIIFLIGMYFYTNKIDNREINKIFKNINLDNIVGANKSDNTCMEILLHEPTINEICHTNSIKPEILFIGDSHAISLYSPLKTDPFINSALIAGNSCYFYPSLIYDVKNKKNEKLNCINILKNIEYVINNVKSIKTIIIINRMPNVNSNVISGFKLNDIQLNERDAFDMGLRNLIILLHSFNLNIIYVLDMPELNLSPMQCERKFKYYDTNLCILEEKLFEIQRYEYTKISTIK